MVALPNVPRVIRFDFFSAFQSSLRQRDRIFIQYSGSLSTADLTTIIGTASTSWNTNISPQQSNLYTLQQIQGTDLSSPTAPQNVATVNRVGGSALSQNPASLAIIIKFKIARRYRGGHPRFYLGGTFITPGQSTTNWASTYATNVNTAWTNFIAALLAGPPAAVGTLTHVNVSYFTGFHTVTTTSLRQRSVPTLRAVPLIDLVLAYSVNPIFGSQRRRNEQSP
jgi:hypothetical protein